MNKTSIRRFALALSLIALTVSGAGVAYAQATLPGGGVSPNGVTGTDPCPKNMVCTVGGDTSSTSTSSSAGTIIQAVIVALGLA